MNRHLYTTLGTLVQKQQRSQKHNTGTVSKPVTCVKVSNDHHCQQNMQIQAKYGENESLVKQYNIAMCGVYSMYVQWWRAVPRCQTRQVREDWAMRRLDCQSPESSSLLSSSSLSSQYNVCNRNIAQRI